jgi:hypothetical protein
MPQYKRIVILTAVQPSPGAPPCGPSIPTLPSISLESVRQGCGGLRPDAVRFGETSLPHGGDLYRTGNGQALHLHQWLGSSRSVHQHPGARQASAQAPSTHVPANLGGERLEEFGFVGVFGRLPNPVVEPMRVVADQDPPTVGLHTV